MKNKRYKKIAKKIENISSSEVSFELNDDLVTFNIKYNQETALVAILNIHKDTYVIEYGKNIQRNISKWKTIETILKHVHRNIKDNIKPEDIPNYKLSNKKVKMISIESFDIKDNDPVKIIIQFNSEGEKTNCSESSSNRTATTILMRDFIQNIILQKVANPPQILKELSLQLYDWVLTGYVPSKNQIKRMRKIIIDLKDVATQTNTIELWTFVLQRSYLC